MRRQLIRLSGEWPITRCSAERGVPAIDQISQVVVEDSAFSTFVSVANRLTRYGRCGSVPSGVHFVSGLVHFATRVRHS